MIYQINGRNTNDSPGYVFKSSEAMAELAVQMDRSGNGFLREEHAYVDTHELARKLNVTCRP